MNTLKRQGTKAFIWDFSGKVAMHGMGFVISIFLARLLAPSDFGLLAMVMVIIGIASIFRDVGLGSALIQRKRVLPIHYASVFYFNITIGSLLTLLTYLSAPYIANFYSTPTLLPLAEVISFSFIIGAFSAVQTTKLRKELNYALLTKVSFSSSFVSGIVGVSLAFNGAGVWSLVAQSLTQGIIYNIIIWSVSTWKPSANFSFKALMQLWTFGFRMFLARLLDGIFTRLDTIIIGKLFPPATLGFFNRAKSLDQMVITYSSGSLISVLFPLLSKIQNDLEHFQKVITKSLSIIIFVVFFLLGGLYLVSHELIIILFGEKWLSTVDYFKILLLSGFGYPISALLVNVLSSRGKSRAFLQLEIYKKIIAIFNLLILYVWGIDAYLYGLIVQGSLSVYLNIIFVSKEITIPKWLLVKPILLQVIITVFISLILEYLNKDLNYGLFSMFVLKGIEYLVLYIIVNKLLKTDAYTYIMTEFSTVFKKVIKNQ